MNNGVYDHACPALMQDGRHITDYRPSCQVHYQMMKQNGIDNSYDLKHFLQHNAVKLQDITRDFHVCKNKCCSSGDTYILPDPNRHVAKWDEYSRRIGYNNQLSLCGSGTS